MKIKQSISITGFAKSSITETFFFSTTSSLLLPTRTGWGGGGGGGGEYLRLVPGHCASWCVLSRRILSWWLLQWAGNLRRYGDADLVVVRREETDAVFLSFFSRVREDERRGTVLVGRWPDGAFFTCGFFVLLLLVVFWSGFWRLNDNSADFRLLDEEHELIPEFVVMEDEEKIAEEEEKEDVDGLFKGFGRRVEPVMGWSEAVVVCERCRHLPIQLPIACRLAQTDHDSSLDLDIYTHN